MKPPPNLGRPERVLWKAIVDSQPSDWFTPATLRLLRRYVRTAVYAEKLHDALDAAAIGSTEAADLLKQVISVNASVGVLAAKMRLSTQVSVTARSTGRMAERGSPIADLIGIRQDNGRAKNLSGFPNRHQ